LDGGQDLLRTAAELYFHAMQENDSKKKAELMLFGNGLIGLHEQIRLQPYIAGSLKAPINTTHEGIIDSILSLVKPANKNKVAEVLSKVLHPINAAAQTIWDEFSTHYLMVLKIPGETLHLGQKLDPAPGQSSLDPPDLAELTNPDLHKLINEYHFVSNPGTKPLAKDWANLPQRMNYIFNLFRSRQQIPALFDPPFTPEQTTAIMNGTVPGGNLG
jgi:hypothetical protein